MRKTVWKRLLVAAAIGMLFLVVIKGIGKDAMFSNDSIPPSVLCCTIEHILSETQFSGTVSYVSDNQEAKTAFGNLSVGDTIVVEAEHFQFGTSVDIQGSQTPYLRDRLDSIYVGYTVQINYLDVSHCDGSEIGASTVLLQGFLEYP
ncbi:MAG: hypothetical protein VB086_04995 [Clostridiaceae bacterium]|nr:hypothetical protein [Clostridiaceae bacterium]